ncbi:MAG: alpha/beta hydrolase [Pseudomonadota bacterium]
MINRLYDSVRLEKEYRPWTDPQAILKKWAQMSASYLERANTERDVPYGVSPAERLDLLKPSAVDAPVLVFIHGGYWQRFDKGDYAYALEPLVASGALVATVNYPLCPEVGLDALVDRVRAACAWVWRHAHNYGGNPERLHVAGHSAGGHLAAMMAATEWSRFQDRLPRDMIKSIIPVSGLFDLEPLRFTSVNEAVRMDSETAKHNSPLFMAPATALPVTVVVGGEETDELRRQSREFADAWRSGAGAMEYIESPGHDHFSVIEAMTEKNSFLTATILRHLELKR